MKAILITADAAPVEIDIKEEDDSCLRDLQRVVGGMIEALPSPVEGRDDITTYINEESKFLCGPNPMATAIMAPRLFAGDAIHGPMVIMGFDQSRGVNLDCPDALIKSFTSIGFSPAGVMGTTDGLGRN